MKDSNKEETIRIGIDSSIILFLLGIIQFFLNIENSPLPWQKLVPDQNNEIILSGRSEFGSLDYICAARAADSSYYVMYIPKGHAFTLNARKIFGKPMRMHWYNPRNGEVIKIGVAETRERYGMTPPSEEDWALVFDDASLLLAPPGATAGWG